MKDSTILKAISGTFLGIGAIYLISLQQYTPGVALLTLMGGFFIGESNGRKEERKSAKEVITELQEEAQRTWQK